MAVNTLTLYMPGSSVGIQVYEGSQLHLILVSQGANSIPSAPGETVRQDPYPQYVDDDELAAALAGVGGGGYTDTQAVAAVENATAVAPAGAWNFTQAPTVSGVPVNAGGLNAEEVALAATGIAATNVRDAILEVLGYADDSSSYWSNAPLTLDLTGGSYKPDSDLNFSVAANETVAFDYYMTFSGANATTANLQAQISAPVGATAEWGPSLDWDAAGQAGTPKQALAGLSDNRSFRLQTGITGIHIRGEITNGSTAGTVVLNLAPYTTIADGPVVRRARSRVDVVRLAA